MDSEALLALGRQTLDDHKARDIVVLDIRRCSSLADYILIASGTSRRQVCSLAEKLLAAMKREGALPLGVEGEKQGEWALVDGNDVIFHIMHPETREYYQLEKLWDMDMRSDQRKNA